MGCREAEVLKGVAAKEIVSGGNKDSVIKDKMGPDREEVGMIEQAVTIS